MRKQPGPNIELFQITFWDFQRVIAEVHQRSYNRNLRTKIIFLLKRNAFLLCVVCRLNLYRDRQQKTKVGILTYLRAPLSVAKILENPRKHAYSWSFGMGLVCVQLFFFYVASLKAGKHVFQKVNLACARILGFKGIQLARLPRVYGLFQVNNMKKQKQTWRSCQILYYHSKHFCLGI